jgi:hypothetical protein
MKKLLLLLISAGITITSLTSYSTGPAFGGQGNRTGGPGSAGTCSQGTACHNSPPLTPTTAAFTLFDKTDTVAATPNTYIPGHLYEVTLKGANGPAGFTKFGFQALALKTGNTQAGTIVLTNITAHRIVPAGGINLIEHKQTITSTDTNLVAKFDWQAPAVGTGVVTFYGIINAVNGDNDRTGDRHNGGTSYVLAELPVVSVKNTNQNADFNVYPNPFTNSLSIESAQTGSGSYQANIYDITGKQSYSYQITPGSKMMLNSTEWKAGIYLVELIGEKNKIIRTLIKQ